MRRFGLVLAALWISLFAGLGSAAAHEQAAGFTEVRLAAAQGDGVGCLLQVCRVEVAHRLVIHDAESTLMEVLGARADLVSDRAAQRKFEAYVAERFALLDPVTSEAVPLTLIGGEVERGYYWVYQEGLIPAGLDMLAVSQSVLIDAIPRQTNRVNVRFDNEIKTLVFHRDPSPQTLRIR
ncbi:MAG: DUF6702 family protein [Pseudomonadota bacterium]